MGEGNENESLMNVRPHPDLLPQEKENRSQRFGGADAPGCRAVSSPKNQKAETMRATSEIHRTRDCYSLSPGERARVRILRNQFSRLGPLNRVADEVTRRKALWFKRVRLLTSAATNKRFMGRASVKTILLSAFLFCLAFASPLLADDVITNVMSPVVSFQYPDNFSSQALTNGGILSPIASYQYFEWPGDGVLQLLSSPRVSYFYQSSTTSGQFVLAGRVTDTVGVGIPGAAVSATVGLTPAAQTTSDASGNYALPSLGAGVYALAARASGHARSARAVTLNAATATQNFQLTPLPGAPTLTQTDRQPPTAFAQPPVGPMGSTLKVFDGAQFVPITAGNTPPPDRMTIVMTHGWVRNPLCGVNEGINGWPTDIARQLRANGITTSIANIVGWDWFQGANACPLPPEENIPPQGVALGLALQSALGAGYATKVHFFGHSLGARVNAAAANYLPGDRPATARQPVSPTQWLASRTHMTLFDQAEVSRIAGKQVVFDGLTLSLNSPTAVLKYAARALQGWKPSMPVQSAWADNYISLVGFYLPNTFNIALQKAEGIAAWRAAGESSNPLVIVAKTLEYAHSYPMEWYSNSIADPTHTPLGFQQSQEYVRRAGLPAETFPSAQYQLGDAYHQSPGSSDPLALEPLPPQNVFQLIVPLFGNGADAVVQGVVGSIQVLGEVSSDVRDGAAQAGVWITQGFDIAGNAALQGGQTVVNLVDSAVLRLRLTTRQLLPGGPQLMSGLRRPMDGSISNAPAMAWLPVAIPPNTLVMAFDFIVTGDPKDDVMVCGIGETNLFSLEAKFIPTNGISSSRLIDVSAWAGTTNELFFGLMRGTSTNATLEVENIRFYSLAQPKLEISRTGNTVELNWPSMAGGYVVESSPNLVTTAWETITNAPSILADRYVLTNSWNDQQRFFRLRSR